MARLQLMAVALGVVAASGRSRADHSASASVYVRKDTDHTTVVAPRLALRAAVDDDTHVDLTYSVDVWTSASVDIVASASQPVTEQRDELNAGVDRVFGDLTLAGAYRFSTEPDYESHGGSIRLAWDFADKASTLAWSAGVSSDRVGRAGDDGFSKDVDTLTTSVSFTQVLDADTLVQAQYELGWIRGYQASAYRFVSFGSDGPCQGFAPLCRPEQNPRERVRHAGALRMRRALGDEWSIGAGYRAYFDDWGVGSHTAKADVAWAPQPRSTIALSYRFYTQSAADHYKVRYAETDLESPFFARDKELSPLSSQRVSLELDWSWQLADAGSSLLTALAVGPTFYRYRDFAMLERSTAIEVTAAIGMELQ